jgi:hypothetical protein
MTVSANSSMDFSRDEIITMAYQYARLVESGQAPSGDDIAMGANFFNLELMNLQSEGIVLRTAERTTLALVTGTAEYTLPAEVIDIEVGPNNQVGTIVPASGGESIVTLIHRSDYLDLATKTNQGRPTQVYVEKQDRVKLVFWPVPDSSSPTFRYAKIRLLRDMDSGTVTTDLARRWLQAVTYAVASQVALAKSMPLELVGFLRAEAERLKTTLRMDDAQRGKIRMRMAHSGRHW